MSILRIAPLAATILALAVLSGPATGQYTPENSGYPGGEFMPPQRDDNFSPRDKVLLQMMTELRAEVMALRHEIREMRRSGPDGRSGARVNPPLATPRPSGDDDPGPVSPDLPPLETPYTSGDEEGGPVTPESPPLRSPTTSNDGSGSRPSPGDQPRYQAPIYELPRVGEVQPAQGRPTRPQRANAARAELERTAETEAHRLKDRVLADMMERQRKIEASRMDAEKVNRELQEKLEATQSHLQKQRLESELRARAEQERRQEALEARAVAERVREESEQQRRIADHAREESEQHRRKAEEVIREMERRLQEAQQQLQEQKEANQVREKAERERLMAEEQRQMAVVAHQAAEQRAQELEQKLKVATDRIRQLSSEEGPPADPPTGSSD